MSRAHSLFQAQRQKFNISSKPTAKAMSLNGGYGDYFIKLCSDFKTLEGKENEEKQQIQEIERKNALLMAAEAELKTKEKKEQEEEKKAKSDLENAKSLQREAEEKLEREGQSQQLLFDIRDAFDSSIQTFQENERSEQIKQALLKETKLLNIRL